MNKLVRTDTLPRHYSAYSISQTKKLQFDDCF